MTLYIGNQKVCPTIKVGTTLNNQNKTITENGTYTADSGYTGLGTVTVNVPSGGGITTRYVDLNEYMSDLDQSTPVNFGSEGGGLTLILNEEEKVIGFINNNHSLITPLPIAITSTYNTIETSYEAEQYYNTFSNMFIGTDVEMGDMAKFMIFLVDFDGTYGTYDDFKIPLLYLNDDSVLCFDLVNFYN